MEILKFWRFLLRRYRIFVAVVVLSAIASLIMSFLVKPVYKNSATVWINTKSLMPEFVGQLPDSLGKLRYVDMNSIIDTFKNLVGSRSTIQHVIEKLDLKDSKGRRILPEKLFDAGMLGVYFNGERSISVDQLSDSEIIEVTAYAADAKEAADMANATVDSLSEVFFNMNRDEAKKARISLERELKQTEDKWKKAEDAKKEYMNSNNILILDTQKGNLVGRLDSLETDLYNISVGMKKAKIGIMESKDKIKEVPEYQLSNITEDLNTIVTSYKTKLAEINIDLQGKLIDLTEEHPDIKAYRKKVEEIKRNVTDDAERVVTSKVKIRSQIYDGLIQKYIDYEVDLAAQEKVYKLIENKLNETKKDMKRLNEVDTAYSQISVEADSYLNLMKSLHAKYIIAVLAERLDTSNALVVDRASIPDSSNMKNYKIFPKRGKILFIAIFLSSMGAFSLIVFIDAIDDKVSTMEDLSSFKERALGYIPYKRKFAVKENASAIQESKYVEVISSLKLSCQGNTGKLVVPLCSIEGKEGKTSLCIKLGEIMANYGNKVVVVDLDMTNKELSKQYNLVEKNGVAEYFNNEDNFARIINNKGNGFDVIPAGRKDSLSQQNLDAELRRFMKELTERYDIIIIDLPALSLTPITADILRNIGSAVMVIRSGFNNRENIERTLDSLREGRVTVSGLVLNASRHNY